MTDQDIENEIQAAGADVAPRVTLADIEAAIESEHYFTAQDGVAAATGEVLPGALSRMTYCVLILRNGYSLSGMSACVSAENFNAEVGRKVAREEAINQAWPLFGFALAEELYRTNQPDV